MDAIIAASIDEIQETEGIGKVIATSLYDYLHDVKNLAVINKLKDAGVLMEEIKEIPAGQAFAGEMVVLTGKLSTMGRREASEIIKQQGGDTQSSITGKPPWWWLVLMQGASWKKQGQRISPSLMKKNF